MFSTPDSSHTWNKTGSQLTMDANSLMQVLAFQRLLNLIIYQTRGEVIITMLINREINDLHIIQPHHV